MLLCFTLPGAVLPDTAQLGHGRPCTNIPSSALRYQFCHDPPSLVLSYPAWPCTAFLPLSGSAAHARSCPAPRDTLETWLLAPLWTSDQLVKGDI